MKIGEILYYSEHIARLKGNDPSGGWLDDDLINGFFMLGVLHYSKPGNIALSSQFFSAYSGYAQKITSKTTTSYDTIKRWTNERREIIV